jgi:OOP family OmpA-OmpF porin
MSLRNFAVAIIVSIAATGCATQTTLSDQAARQAYPTVAELESKLAIAKANNLGFLSPRKYQEARSSFDRSMEWARADDSQASQYARDGLDALSVASQNAANAADIFEDVLKARKKAVLAGADRYTASEFRKVDEAFTDLIKQLEDGQEERAKAGRSEVSSRYAELELGALKQDTTEKAKEAIARAREQNVDSYAPKTLKQAEEELALATSVLEADRTGIERAERHSRIALDHALRATEIAEIVKVYNTSDFTSEDIVLWYQNELSEAVKPMDPDLPFEQPNKEVIAHINGQLSTLITDSQAMKMEKDQAIQALTMEKQALVSSTQISTEKDKEIADRFSSIQTLFNDDEAEVYRQADNVLIRAHGFQFAVGKSEIEAKNFDLMNKIITAVKKFPNASVMVTGHTDSQGSDSTNQELSQSRADTVTRFITQVGGVGLEKITATGYGESRPVANNETTEGRAANRRVEILIDNSAGL